MNEPKLGEALALLDDARCLLIDVVDGNPKAPLADLNNLDAARQFINSAIPYIQLAQENP